MSGRAESQSKIGERASLDVALSTRASQATLVSILAQLDVSETVLAKLVRWGRNLEPSWIHGAAQTAPAAVTALVTRTVTTGRSGYLWGFLIGCEEANDFLINWTSGGVAYSIRIVFAAQGTMECEDSLPLNEGLPADQGTAITITNVNAGAAGMIYQARLLYGEV